MGKSRPAPRAKTTAVKSRAKAKPTVRLRNKKSPDSAPRPSRRLLSRRSSETDGPAASTGPPAKKAKQSLPEQVADAGEPDCLQRSLEALIDAGDALSGAHQLVDEQAPGVGSCGGETAAEPAETKQDASAATASVCAVETPASQQLEPAQSAVTSSAQPVLEVDQERLVSKTCCKDLEQ